MQHVYIMDVSSNDSSGSAPGRVYAFLKTRIITGEVPGGDMLSEGEIARLAGVSRTPVREALMRLQAEGYVRIYPKRGVMVQPVADGEIRHVYDARHLLETHAFHAVAALPAEARTAALEPARAHLAEQDAAIAAGDLVQYARTDALFHGTLIAAAGNPILTDFFTSVRERQERLTHLSVSRNLERARAFNTEHHRMLEHLDNGNTEAAIALLSAHLTLSKDMLA